MTVCWTIIPIMEVHNVATSVDRTTGGRPGHLHRATAPLDRQVGAPVNDEGVDHFGRTFSLAK